MLIKFFKSLAKNSFCISETDNPVVMFYHLKILVKTLRILSKWPEMEKDNNKEEVLQKLIAGKFLKR